MKATVQLGEGSAFHGTSGTGHAVQMDVAPEVGGRDTGPRPMEMLLLGLGGCTAIDVLHILRKGDEPIENMRLDLLAERSDDIPKVFKKIHVHFMLVGARLDAKKVQRAIDLSAKKYCSASLMLNKTAQITYDFEIVEELT
ncbi:MAG: hypothetical protein CL398_01435 [Acidiferrobacteraceae bacterium]|nr:hypothetical protein [Acidiferrobacteraceae bacterium]|tara:strand:- start:4264 stop:4686 length:423 start_codon:yes stop_codon:yes gene_type:complete